MPPNAYDPALPGGAARLGEAAGADRLGLSAYELAPGESLVYHYHLGREELLIVLRGTVALRTPDGWRDVEPGGVAAFPRGPSGAHGCENRSGESVRLLMVSEQNGPNVSVYPDTDEVGVFDAAHPADRRFGARFRLGDALGGYGGGEPRA